MAPQPRNFDGEAFLVFLENKELITKEVVRRVTSASSHANTQTQRVIVELGLLDEETVYRELSAYIEVPYLVFEEFDISLLGEDLLQFEYMKRAEVIPAQRTESGYLLASTQPNMGDTLSSVGYLLDAPVRGALAAPTTINAVLEAKLSGPAPAERALSGDIDRLLQLANEGPVISLVNDLIGKAVGLGASDVHIEAQEYGSRVRYRIDGALQIDRIIPDELKNSVTSRLKIMANLNISERRRPQDGRATTVVRGRNVDIRLSTLPTQHGESIVLRILDRSRVQLEWEALSFSPERVAQIEKIVSQPNGIFLVAGPTGSGKTTTLYTALKGINSEDRKIITVEDPIEYALEGVNQVQVDPAIDMTFANALRAILRQDPNVVMVGEIRDEETAEIAVRAALIGRLVLSTIHTNDALGAVDRLLDLNIPPYLVGSTLRGVLSQRLVRANCKICVGDGCDACTRSGHAGRMSLSEMLVVSKVLGDEIGKGVRGSGLLKTALSAGFVPIIDSAETLVQSGIVSRQEVDRAIGQF